MDMFWIDAARSKLKNLTTELYESDADNAQYCQYLVREIQNHLDDFQNEEGHV